MAVVLALAHRARAGLRDNVKGWRKSASEAYRVKVSLLGRLQVPHFVHSRVRRRFVECTILAQTRPDRRQSLNLCLLGGEVPCESAYQFNYLPAITRPSRCGMTFAEAWKEKSGKRSLER
jgi:hypothetical protein